MELYLVRHAIAEDRDPGRWPGDRERPLSEAGIEKFQVAAAGLAHQVPSVDAVWSSPFRRAWQTAQLLHTVAGWPAPVEFQPLEPERPADRALRRLAAEWKGERLALVGHAPGLDQLAALALFGHRDAQPFALRKGGVACLTFGSAVGSGVATLTWLATPKMLRALAG